MADETPVRYPLGRDIAACVLMTAAQQAPSKDLASPLRWLIRYVQRCEVKLHPSEPVETAIRGHFSRPAWRLVCRSGRDGFLPILRDRLLTFHDLVRCAEALVANGWQEAPQPRLLSALLRQRYEFFNSVPSVPVERTDMILLRLAQRQEGLTRREFLLVSRWLTQSDAKLKGQEQWAGLLRRAKAWGSRQRAEKEMVGTAPWYFYCKSTLWRGFEIVPLTNMLELWEEGDAMSNCVFDLRSACVNWAPSRFFSVRRNGKRMATLELEYQPQDISFKGTDRLFGRWDLRDCRLPRIG